MTETVGPTKKIFHQNCCAFNNINYAHEVKITSREGVVSRHKNQIKIVDEITSPIPCVGFRTFARMTELKPCEGSETYARVLRQFWGSYFGYDPNFTLSR